MTVTKIKEWVGPSAAARIADMSSQHLIRLADAGKVPCERTSLGRLFDPAVVRKWAEERNAA